MPVIIDAYNVLHVVGVLPPDLAGIDVDGLVELIERSRFAKEKVQLVCDGAAPRTAERPGRGRGGGVSVRHSGAGRSADSVIIAAITASTAPRRLTVVSSDREIRRAARKRRCVVMTSEAFLKRVAADVSRSPDGAAATARKQSSRPGGPLPASAVERWARAFSVSDADLARMQDEIDREAAATQPVASPAPAAKTPKQDADARPGRSRRSSDDEAFRDSLRQVIAEAERLLESGPSPLATADRRDEAVPAAPSGGRRGPKPRAPAARNRPRPLDVESLREMFDEARRMLDEDDSS